MRAVAAHGPFSTYTHEGFIGGSFEDGPLMAAGKQGHEPVVKAFDGDVLSFLVDLLDKVEERERRHVGDYEFAAQVEPHVAVLNSLDKAEGELGYLFKFLDGLLQFDEVFAQVVGHIS
jgi:hypothetical protein